MQTSAGYGKTCQLRLLTLDDLRVRDGEVQAKSEDRRIHVIYRRFEEERLESNLPEIEGVYREGKVNLVNALEAGVADDKAIFPYVPDMIERYLGEEPVLGSATTLSLSEPEQRAEALEVWRSWSSNLGRVTGLKAYWWDPRRAGRI